MYSFCKVCGKLAQWLTFFALKDGILYRRMELDALSPGKSTPEADHHLPFLEVQCSLFGSCPGLVNHELIDVRFPTGTLLTPQT